MRVARLIALLSLLTLPSAASAIQLRWNSGSSQLAFSESTRCTLIVEADTSAVLPSGWQLLWVTQGCAIRPVVEDSESSGSVCEVAGRNGEDLLARKATVYFCSDNGAPSEARIVLDLSVGSKGKLKVVAIDPTDLDSTDVLESNEVTFNGGVSRSYPPTILRISSDHSSIQLQTEAVGVGLDVAEVASVVSADKGWSIPLEITEQDANVLRARADVGAAISGAVLRLEGESDLTSVDIPEDDVLDMAVTTNESYFQDPSERYYTKDFTVVATTYPFSGQWQTLYHIYYTRDVKPAFKGNGPGQIPADSSDIHLGHAWSRDLVHWASWDSTQIAAKSFRGQHTFDRGHTWAPSILDINGQYHMFYTGVSLTGEQSIGYATTFQIDTVDTHAPPDPRGWTRHGASVFTAPSWAYQGGVTGSPKACRDPFVMPDPDNPGRFLMYYVANRLAEPINVTNGEYHLAVGVARNVVGGINQWSDIGPFPMTGHALAGSWRTESPSMFPDSIGWKNVPYSSATQWRLMYSDGGDNLGNRIGLFNDALSVGSSVSDTSTASWANETVLHSYLGWSSASMEFGMQAVEPFRLGNAFFLGGFLTGNLYWTGQGGTGYGILLRRMRWYGTPATQFRLSTVDLTTGVGDTPSQRLLRLSLLGPTAGRGQVRFRIENGGARVPGRLDLYDITGRLVGTLLNGEIVSGESHVVWNGEGAGGHVGSGVYFARLKTNRSSAGAVLRVPLIR